jgi:hypothetical protein
MALITSYIALLYTARPRVSVTLLGNNSYAPLQLATLEFRVAMKSRLRRAASDMRIFVNFTPEVEPLEAAFGSALELRDSNVRIGKGPSRYLVVTGVRVSKDEPVPYEDFTIRIRTPQVPGTYRGWVTCFAHGSTDDCGVSHFQITVA